ncbi:hypothetical protein CDO28_01565 [Sinorhizobium meliloti]|nr:hypothetical protein CDO28_01565 [Sinorhizobium meliloti]
MDDLENRDALGVPLEFCSNAKQAHSFIDCEIFQAFEIKLLAPRWKLYVHVNIVAMFMVTLTNDVQANMGEQIVRPSVLVEGFDALDRVREFWLWH